MKTQCTTSEQLAAGVRFENLRVQYFQQLGRFQESRDAHERATFYWERLQQMTQADDEATAA